MPFPGQYPVAIFSSVQKGFDALEKKFVDPQQFMEQLGSDDGLLEAVVNAYKDSLRTIWYTKGDIRYSLNGLLQWIYGLDMLPVSSAHITNEEMSKQITRRDRFYSNPQSLAELFAGLDVLSTSLVIMHFGLANGEPVSKVGVANAHKISDQQCRYYLDEAVRIMRATEEEKLATDESVPDVWLLKMPIETIELSARVTSALRRGNITTVGQLIDCGPDDLQKIPHIGPGSVHEIADKLAERHMKLK